jgi:hypothetical protein
VAEEGVGVKGFGDGWQANSLNGQASPFDDGFQIVGIPSCLLAVVFEACIGFGRRHRREAQPRRRVLEIPRDNIGKLRQLHRAVRIEPVYIVSDAHPSG